jgi:C-terminal processing protease CtpA/Prc
MASFRPDGRLYDGRGVAPDVPVAPRPTDLLGRTDAVLDEALRRLR